MAVVDAVEPGPHPRCGRQGLLRSLGDERLYPGQPGVLGGSVEVVVAQPGRLRQVELVSHDVGQSPEQAAALERGVDQLVADAEVGEHDAGHAARRCLQRRSAAHGHESARATQMVGHRLGGDHQVGGPRRELGQQALVRHSTAVGLGLAADGAGLDHVGQVGVGNGGLGEPTQDQQPVVAVRGDQRLGGEDDLVSLEHAGGGGGVRGHLCQHRQAGEAESGRTGAGCTGDLGDLALAVHQPQIGWATVVEVVGLRRQRDAGEPRHDHRALRQVP